MPDVELPDREKQAMSEHSTLSPEGTPVRRLAGRWRVGTLIGTGGYGSVWSATDESTGEEVAVKFVTPRTEAQAKRLRKEVAALRLLRCPGVVHLHASGEEDGQYYIVMEYVRGLPFPGQHRGWEAIRPLAVSMLQTLRVIHAHGVVHRDLKPPNVLVTAEGRVVLLDFGIARGEMLGTTVTGAADILGTPAYIAPEQVDRRAPIDGRADLFAFGVMLYEALSRNLPFHGANYRDLMLARLVQEAPPLDLPGLPPEVPQLVRRLLARNPADRPASAEVALSVLHVGEAGRPPPWLGGREGIDTLAARLRAGRACELWGPPGSGKSRVVEEIVKVLREEGRQVHVLKVGHRPLESLSAVLGRLGGAEALQQAEVRLKEKLKEGNILVADDVGRLDRWSRGLLERLRPEGAILRVQPSPDALLLEALPEEALWSLFHGPDQVLHLREDAARVLRDRTGGMPGGVVAEIQGWVASGEAVWSGDRLRLDRRAVERVATGPTLGGRGGPMLNLEDLLDELLGWVVLAGTAATAALLVRATDRPEWEVEAELEALEELGALRRLPGGGLQPLTVPRVLSMWTEERRAGVHWALSRALDPHSMDRLLHLLAAGESEDVPEAALTFASSALDTGGAGRAMAALRLAVEEAPPDPRVLETLAQAALVDGTARALAEARRVVEAAGAGELGALLAGWEAAGERRYTEAELGITQVNPFQNPELEAWRVGLPVRIAVTTDPAVAEDRLRTLDVDPESPVGRRKTEWWGHLRYRQKRFTEAAELHTEAARRAEGVARRCNSLVNAGLSWRDAHQPQKALVAFSEAAELAAEARLCVLEGHARVGQRSVLYRLDALTELDEELIEAVAALGQPALLASACLNEAAVAWRTEKRGAAERLAREAARRWDTPATRDGWLLASALACAAGGHREEAATLVEELRYQQREILRWQSGALIAAAGGRVEVDTGELERRVKMQNHREAVLDLEEMLRYLSIKRS